VEFVETLLQVVGQGSYRLVPFPEEKRRIDIGNYYADYRKIQTILGWKPTVDLREGLERTVAYYRKHRDHYWTR
jgi:UDP-glucose 4-epimerase